MPLQNFVDGDTSTTIDAAWLNGVDVLYFTVFAEATTAALARTALGVSATGTDLPLAGGTMTGDITLSACAINETLATLPSHATTGDIWAAGAVISWTGTATTTAFPAAPVAGARRVLICAGACAFTAGANLLIKGIASGVTVTMKANARVEVVALTTTQFQLEYTLSGTFTATATGFTASITATWYYDVVNGSVRISSHNTVLGGTSNTTAFTVTGFPAEITPSDDRLFNQLSIADNSTRAYIGYGVLASTSVLTLYVDPTGTTWTASNTKTLYNTEWSYLL